MVPRKSGPSGPDFRLPRDRSLPVFWIRIRAEGRPQREVEQGVDPICFTDSLRRSGPGDEDEAAFGVNLPLIPSLLVSL